MVMSHTLLYMRERLRFNINTAEHEEALFENGMVNGSGLTCRVPLLIQMP